MIQHLSNLKVVLETLSKVKTAFEHLRSSGLFIKELDKFDLVEKYFSLSPLPKGRIQLKGRLSNYTLNNQMPIYTPAHLRGIKQAKTHEFDTKKKQLQEVTSVELKVKELNVPAICYQPITLADQTKAKLIWLYPKDSEGLVFKAREKTGLVRDKLLDAFEITPADKPIPILVSLDFPQYNLYKTVKITGRIYTSPLEFLKELSAETDAFLLDYFNHCFRPFSSQEGILAIDAREPHGQVEIIEENHRPFSIIYTVQGIVEVTDHIAERYTDEVLIAWSDAIPDRQGLDPSIRYFGDSVNKSAAIISIGETYWQKDDNNFGVAAFKEVNLNNHSYNQAGVTALANNWQVWQKEARNKIRKKFNIEPKIKPLVCSNPAHEKLFHPNGLQISKAVEEKLLNENPATRKSIDWLGISVGKS